MKDDTMLARWLNGELDEKELKAFMASPEYDTYRKIKEYSAQLTVPEANMDSLYARILSNRNREQKKVRTLNPWISRIAAMLVMALGITYFFYTTNTTTQLAANGERADFLLPDNSEVVLNADSKAEYRTWNWDDNRKIELEGEAFFKVAKGQTFDVVTDLGTVTVVGTQFNVKARGDRFDVTCFEGKVKVTSDKKEVLLLPGETIAFEKGKALDTTAEEGAQPGWITYETYFAAEPLTNVIAEMERQYKVDIELNAQVKNTYVGRIPMNDIDTALDLIKTAYHLKSEKAGNKIILTLE
ncbi:MAG TPA: FecR domain-containing protein [Flavobacterium sp.]|nr:FecR domain-containing protein [Flavobacterium sp.]